MDSQGLKTNHPRDYKHILLKKLSYSVIGSVVSQLFIFIFYIFLLNFQPFNVLSSLKTFTQTLVSLSTWIYLLLFTTVVFAQSIICAKDYILTPKYCSTRFSKVKAIFSNHIIFLLFLHVMVGFALVWLMMGFSSYKLMLLDNTKYYIMENSLYLLYLGSWMGLFYFIKIYTSEKRILFPVISQMKWLQFKAQLLPLLKKSKQQAFWPCVYFIGIYAIIGRIFNSYLPLNVKEETGDFKLYAFSLFFASLIYFSLNLMTFFYELFLTETLEFPIENVEGSLSLKDALVSNMPVIQHLSCQDLFYLSAHSKGRRQILFALSNPGHHPHNWNNIIEALLKILKDYTNCLNQSLNNILNNDKDKEKNLSKVTNNAIAQQKLPEPTMTPLNRAKLRNMGILNSPECVGLVTIKNPNYISENKEELCKKITDKFDQLVENLKQKLGINFLFKELPEASIQRSLGEGQMIVWIVQSVSCLCEASKSEDRFGIVQKDLPVIINTLVELKLALEKLNRVPALNKRGPGLDDYNCKMKMSLINATKRSLYNLVLHFGQFFKDFHLKADVLAQLGSFNGHRDVTHFR